MIIKQIINTLEKELLNIDDTESDIYKAILLSLCVLRTLPKNQIQLIELLLDYLDE